MDTNYLFTLFPIQRMFSSLSNLKKKKSPEIFPIIFFQTGSEERKIRSLFLRRNQRRISFAYREKNQTFLERKFLSQTYLLGNAVSFKTQLAISLNHQVSLRLLGRWLSFSTLPEEEFPSKWREEELRSSKALYNARFGSNV